LKPYVKQNSVYMRPSELYHLKGNPIKAKEKLGWEPKTTFNELIKLMIEVDIERYQLLLENYRNMTKKMLNIF
jgi:GDPmannose 4,6-dehydratase